MVTSFQIKLPKKTGHKFKIRKCAVIQCGLEKVSIAHKKILSHFYISKKFWKPWRKPANLPFFRLPAPIGQKFDMVSRIFLRYKDGSNFFYNLLRPLPIHTVLPHIFEKKGITLLYSKSLINKFLVSEKKSS